MKYEDMLVIYKRRFGKFKDTKEPSECYCNNIPTGRCEHCERERRENVKEFPKMKELEFKATKKDWEKLISEIDINRVIRNSKDG